MDGKIGHYRIVAELGRGGMGVVYKAHEDSLNRYVAIKVLGEHLTQDQTYVSRFVREARAAAALNHPNITQIYFIGEDRGRHYFVMEYVQGRSVHQILRDEGRLPPARAAQIVQQAASGLAAAHRQGVIHRDIKPANLMINDQGLVKIADFGLALQPDEGTRLTASGMLVGTPGYLSPEQCLGEKLGPRTDIYSLGMTYYEMLTGSMPFKADSPFALVRQIVEVEPPEVTELNPEVDPETVAILRRMIAKDPEQRYSSCDELLADLTSYLEGAVSPRGKVRAMAGDAASPEPEPLKMSMPLADAVDSSVAPAGSPTVAAAETVPLVDAATRPLPPPSKRLPLVLAGVAALLLVLAVGVAAALFFGPRIMRLLTAGRERLVQATAASEPAPTELSTREPLQIVESQDANAASDSVDAEEAEPPVSKASPGSAALAPDERSDARSEAVPTDPSSGVAGFRAEPQQQLTQPAVRQPQGSRPGSDPPPSAGDPALEVQSPLSPPPPTVTLPRTPAVAVVGIGERLLAVAAESQLEAELLGYGLDIVDESASPRINDLLTSGQDDPYLEDLLFLLRQEGVDVLVLARAEFLSERELYYLGRVDVAITSQIHVNGYLVGEESGVGAGWSERLEYTALNAQRQAQSFLDTMVSDLAAAVQGGWAAYRHRALSGR